jgi:hypothetical protein
VSILTEDIKNTRFILTVTALGMLGLAIAGDIGLILFAAYTGTTVDSTLLTVFTTAIGLLGGLVTTAYNAYFKDRQQEAAAAAETAAAATQ